ncbi:MAG: alkaline phosphatase D family protein [Armatimonadota bacterium]|nr:alkaline phosphatase D family protein [Armatimonadota bacterium]MDR7451134.1 alkaline phosphatase D family protein [Armatimonadota bacterium]MDR7467261.1 alkaline phosphatase D family protein [Armatimonadota bacterium]MDR7494522.1 alkaline phosphatase D family protein [Armatimonadota bacterium]MDR7499901.1 alkaline phosphatase D family protein [Armatimonadota bacterium]
MVVLTAALTVAAPAAPVRPQGRIGFPDGAASGDVTDSAAVLWTRAAEPAAVRFEFGTSPALGSVIGPVQATAATDCTVKVELTGLRPGTRYYYRPVAEEGGRAGAGLVGSFVTAPEPTADADVVFLWGADTSERYQPFRIFEAMRTRQPQFFLFLGDTVYADLDGYARSLQEYRAAYRRNRADEAFRRLLRATAVYAVWDDHEVANNFDRTHHRLPVGRQAFLESWPVREDPADRSRLYRAFRWGRHLEVFILDTRQYRTPASWRDGPEKTMLGAAQKAWLQRGLLTSPATFKVIGSSVTLKYHGPDSWEGYAAEREELLGFIRQHRIRGVVFVAGDVHYAAVLRHPGGIVEGVAGPLAMHVTRRPAAAGKPEAEFVYNGGSTFGLVRATTSGLEIELYDVEGRLLHRTTVRP